MHGIGDPARANSARSDPLAGLVGGSQALAGLRRDLHAIAAADSTLLLSGETGTGKGLVAGLVHEASPRARGPFVHVDCAALAPTVIESELFGHERGAFTGAELARDGRLATAAGGTLFLDEVGELEGRLQAKLLRALQERAFERVGGSRTLPMTARIVAATNRNLRAAVADGSFRADLYYRLRVLELRLPPLRERPEDIPALVEHGLRETARRLGRPAPETTECFERALAAHAWPGNVRELLNLLERLLVRHPGATLDADLLAAELEPWPDAPPVGSGAVRDVGGGEAARIARALVETGGNVARAARRLRLPRGTLRHRIERFGLRHLIPRD
jgi:two-component system response regulator AtoC